MPMPARPGAVAMRSDRVGFTGMSPARDADASVRLRCALTFARRRARLARSSLRLMCHCCAIDRTLFTSQYSTSPAGKKKKNTLKAIGMIFITFACTGSGGSGFSRVWMIMVAPIRMEADQRHSEPRTKGYPAQTNRRSTA